MLTGMKISSINVTSYNRYKIIRVILYSMFILVAYILLPYVPPLIAMRGENMKLPFCLE